MKKINSKNAPKAIWPYSQAIQVWKLIFCSGQIWIDPKTWNIIDIWISLQTHQVCKNIQEVLKWSKCSIKNIIKTTVYLKNIADFSIVNEIYWQYFKHKPARSTIEVSNLPKWALIEIEAIASLD